jgi:type I restriction enzyme, S subunit
MMEKDAAPNIDINPNDWVEIRRILRTCVPEYEVWAFGSRAKWTAKPYSDLDLAILTDRPLSLQKAAELRSALDESTIPIKVDFVDWAATSESFREIIEAHKVVVLQPATDLAGWTFKRLIDCTVDGVLSYGIVQPGQHDERGVPIVRVNNISTGQLHIAEPLRVAPDIEAIYQRTRLEGGEVLLTVVGTTGQSAIVPKTLAGWNVARAVAVIRPKPEIGARWIHICLQSKAVQQFLDERANTTVQKTLNLGDVKEVLIPIPPPGVKEVIESIAVGLDDKVELNRRMNTTLEAMARALYQSWFVDFDPVRAKLDGRAPAAIDPTSAVLFPEHFTHDEYGMLPVGWRHDAIEEICALNAWTLGKNDDLEALEYVEISEVSRGDIATIAAYARGEEPSRARRRLRHGDTALSTVRPDRGSYFLALNPPENRIASTGFAVLTPTKVPWSFLHAALTQPEVSDHLGQMADGGAYPAVRPEIIGAMQVALPNEPKILEAFHRSCAPLFEQAEANRIQSRTLATLRNTLLPKLLSGELSVTTLESSTS